MGRVVLVTGSTDGIGRETARALAAAGMRVIVHGRSRAKVDATMAELGIADGVAFDLGSQAAIRRGVDQLFATLRSGEAGSCGLHVDVLVNNAGVFCSERVVNADGIELTLAVNHVAPFLLAELLKPARTINVASIAHTRGDLAYDRSSHFGGYAAYAASKLANVMHALSLADRGREAYSLHPGVIGTKLLRAGFGPVRGDTVQAGARTSVRLASAETIDEPSGTYFSDGVATPPASTARDRAARDRLWEATERLIRQGPPDRAASRGDAESQ